MASKALETETPYWDRGRERRAIQDRSDGAEYTALKQLPKDHPDFPHGTTGWQYGCRCDTCVTEMREWRAQWKREVGITDPHTEYIPQAERNAALKVGTRSCYNKCRKRKEGPHPECREANREYQRSYMKLHRNGLRLRGALG